jgi:hypothetical protein
MLRTAARLIPGWVRRLSAADALQRQTVPFSRRFLWSPVRFAACLLLLVFPPLVYADCAQITDDLSKTFDRPGGDPSGMPSFIECKRWPEDPTRFIVAIASQDHSALDSSANNDAGFYDLTVLLLKNTSDQVVARLVQKRAFSFDAIQLIAIAIDSAPYELASGQRAFGVRAHFANSSSVSSSEHEQLNLYLVQGAELRQILGNLLTAQKLYEKVDDCQETLADRSWRLIVAPHSTLGKADLILKEKVVIDKSSLQKGHCVSKKNVVSKSTTLRFDGQNYLVPEDLRSDY